MQHLNHSGNKHSAMDLLALPNPKHDLSLIAVKTLSKSELLFLKQEMQDSLKQLQTLKLLKK